MAARVSGCGNPSGRVYGRLDACAGYRVVPGRMYTGVPGSHLSHDLLSDERVFRLAPVPPLFRACGVNGPEKVLLKTVILEILRLKKRSDLSK